MVERESSGFAAPLSPEVEWYLEDRGYVLPKNHAVPLWRTPEPNQTTPEAKFSAARVDKVIKSLRVLKHTKGRWAGEPLEPNAVQVAYFIAPIFGWIHKNEAGNWARVIQEVYIEMPRKGAKALALGTPVLTQAGWKSIEDIHPGDLVVHATTGDWTEVTAESGIFEDRQLYTVTDSKHRSLTVDGEHLWTVYNRSAEKWQTVTTDKLIAQGLTYGARGDRRFSLPISAAVRGGQATGLSGKASNRCLTATIKSIEPAGIGQAKCIAIAADDGLFLAGPDLMPTHNTTLASGLGMYLAFADDEPGAEVIFGAASRDQAGAAFRPVEALARSNRQLKAAGITATKTLISKQLTGSTIKAVSSRGDLAHGANVHGALIDELHVHKNPDLLEAIESGTGAREQPLTIIITTADDGKVVSVYAKRRHMMEQVCSGILNQPATYAVIFAAEEGVDNPFLEKTWQKVNPLYPITPTPEFMRKAADKAKASPTALASFLRLHLGIRAKQGTQFIKLADWDKNQQEYKESLLYGRQCFGGLDLSSVSDLTALSWLFPEPDGGYTTLQRLWLPEAALDPLDNATAGSASDWVATGWITLTPGNVVDYDFIRAVIKDDAAKFNPVEIGYDRWNSSQMVIDLQDKDGMSMAKVGQGMQSMSPALKEYQRLILKRLLIGNSNPVMRWMVDNLRVTADAANNLKPDKDKSLSKIDGVSASLNALFCAMTSDYTPPVASAYESAHLEVL